MSGHHGRSLLAAIVLLFEFHRWDVPDRLEQPSVVEPIHPFESRELKLLDVPPRPTPADHLRLVQADDRLGESVVVRVAETAYCWFDLCFRKSL